MQLQYQSRNAWQSAQDHEVGPAQWQAPWTSKSLTVPAISFLAKVGGEGSLILLPPNLSCGCTISGGTGGIGSAVLRADVGTLT